MEIINSLFEQVALYFGDESVRMNSAEVASTDGTKWRGTVSFVLMHGIEILPDELIRSQANRSVVPSFTFETQNRVFDKIVVERVKIEVVQGGAVNVDFIFDCQLSGEQPRLLKGPNYLEPRRIYTWNDAFASIIGPRTDLLSERIRRASIIYANSGVYADFVILGNLASEGFGPVWGGKFTFTLGAKIKEQNKLAIVVGDMKVVQAPVDDDGMLSTAVHGKQNRWSIE